MVTGTIIIGGGPAGLTAACFSRGPTLVLERLAQPARKLLATGGGRCNLTHDTDATGISAAFGKNARFMMPALTGFAPHALRAFFKSQGVATCVEPDGCVFPASQQAADIVMALQTSARTNNAEIKCGVRVVKLLLEKSGTDNHQRVCAVETNCGTFPAQRVILATGGQSYPNLGSDGSGLLLARAAGLQVTPPLPALAGLITQETWPTTLAGLVLQSARVRLIGKGASQTSYCGPLLFTHKGLSGPPALNLSGEIATRLQTAHALAPTTTPTVAVEIALLADRNLNDWLQLFDKWRLQMGGRAIHNLLAGEIPRALAHILCENSELLNLAVARIKKEKLRELARNCSELTLNIAATETWSHAMVTRGGVALSELNPKTLFCRRIPNLACVGELVDLDGPCGGYNLTWAFASGRLAGMAEAL